MRGMLVQLVAMMAIISVLGGITLSCGKFAEEYTANRTLALATSAPTAWWEDEASISQIIAAMEILADGNDLWLPVVYCGTVPRLEYNEDLVFKSEGIAADTPTVRNYGIRKTTGGYRLYVEHKPIENISGRSWTPRITMHAREGVHYGS